MERKKVIYISGPIAGVEKYWEAFEKMEDKLIALGFIPISPTRLPEGLTPEQRIEISLATIRAADAVLFLEDWANDEISMFERDYCIHITKPSFVDPNFMKEILRWTQP